ncbi:MULTISPECIES: ABC transporter permease [Clostridia]|uniref:ABC transporter permease n=1 Tax=Clostridia TaxID=186801 RepID=UPI000EA37788|nr:MULTISPECIES: ABC transporter permease [Clostridia]NBJ68961.1 ABC transporter permease [Roseburia sp. 1XD42-34]RKI79864.1 ABC transporter permease [Clostridium sp. 1xD42-85]
MHFIRTTLLFFKYNLLQLKRKWLTLPLVLLFPVVMVSLLAVIIITFITPEDESPIQVGLVDLDESKETKLLVNMLDEASQLGSYIHLHNMEETVAKQKISSDELSAYIAFPKNFTANLYQGIPVTLPIVGNPKQPIQSQMVKSLIESVTRHIRASQANVLTINQYAKQLPLDNATRNDLVFEQFKEFVFYTIGRKQLMQEEQIVNQATASPTTYYSLAGWFIIFTIWLLLIYNFLYQDVSRRMRQRMALYEVKVIQLILAKLIVTLSLVTMISLGLLFALTLLLQWDVQLIDTLRIIIVTVLYSTCFLLSVSIIEATIASHRLRLLTQIGLTSFILLLSGAIMPTIYLPLWLQEILPFSFSSEALYWLQEVLLNERLYVDYLPLLLMTGSGSFILLGITIGKERIY